VSHLLPRFHRLQLAREDSTKVAKITGQSTASERVQPGLALAKPGDPRVLRAIPVIARGVGGTIPGTEPLGALLHREANARLRLSSGRATVSLARETPVKNAPCTP
jgi:hypothetical protein